MINTQEQIFGDAIALPIEKRDAFLDQQCAGDRKLRQRLDVLLAAHEKADGILDLPDTYPQTSAQLDIDVGQDIGNYRLLQKIGEGGFGVVFMAEQRKPVTRKVAIKVIKPGMDSKAVVARFEGERQALAMMDHPNIAKIFDGGTSDTGHRPYFVMELVQGVPITEFCDANALTTQERLELFITVCNAVHHAHQKGIIHRDIKPNNVMVTLHDGKPVVKVIDFGVAKALHQRLTEKTLFTQYGMMVGTPQYMSPEQAEMTGLDVDTRSDVYSLAVLLYELMTGATPIKSEDLRTAGMKEMQRMICEDEAVRPSLRLSVPGEKLTVLAKHRSITPAKLSKEIKGDLDWIVLKGLEKERTRRYDSASELAADVRRALGNQPVLAGPPSIFYRGRKFVLRNRFGIALAAALLAVATAIGLGLLNNRRHQLAAIEKDTSQLNNGIDEANALVVAAVEASTSSDLWKTADLSATRLSQLLEETSANRLSVSRAEQFLENYEQARQDRAFTFSMEELLINHSTDQTIENLQFMRGEFLKILQRRGFDLNRLDRDQFGELLQQDRAPLKVTDAVELWLMVRIRLAAAGGEAISDEEIQNWTASLSVGDPHPMRTAIRETIFKTETPGQKFLTSAIKQQDVANACARKLSWLAQAYDLVGLEERADETRQFALAQHASDLLLNYEHAMYLLQRNQADQAVRYLMRCTSLRPQNAGVWKGLAEALGQNDELAKAQNAINKAIDLNPNDAVSRLTLAKLLLQDGEPAAAVAAAEVARSLDEELADAYRLFGQAKLSLKDYTGALLALENFKMLAPAESDSVEELIAECRRGLIKLEPSK